MKYTLNLTHINTFDLFDEVLKVDMKTNLFQDLRNLYSKKVQDAIAQSKLNAVLTERTSRNTICNKKVEINPIPSIQDNRAVLGIDFCDDSSMEGINYQHRPYEELPSLDTFVKRKNYSIGNFIYSLDNSEDEVDVITNDDVKIVGYLCKSTPKKQKSWLKICGVHFNYDSILRISSKYLSIIQAPQLIDVQPWSTDFPQIFMCRITGKFYVCNCFKNYIDWKQDFFRIASLYENDIIERINNIQYLDAICHYCNKTTPATQTRLSGYSSFLLRYASYFHLECKKRYGTIYHFDKEDRINLENELRQYWGDPKIGEKWVSETTLYHLVKEILSDYKIIFHYRGKEMQGLELDIFVPELSLGIEYQGEQHYKVIEHWGGEEGLKNRQSKDTRKKKLCEDNGYALVEFYCDEDITKSLIVSKIGQYISLDNTIINENGRAQLQSPSGA